MATTPQAKKKHTRVGNHHLKRNYKELGAPVPTKPGTGKQAHTTYNIARGLLKSVVLEVLSFLLEALSFLLELA
jgi:hypothetical protein